MTIFFSFLKNKHKKSTKERKKKKHKKKNRRHTMITQYKTHRKKSDENEVEKKNLDKLEVSV